MKDEIENATDFAMELVRAQGFATMGCRDGRIFIFDREKLRGLLDGTTGNVLTIFVKDAAPSGSGN